MTSYELKLEKFSGPLEKLLELIEERKLEIAEVSLAKVTDDFLKYLKTLTAADVELRLVADFISVASRLILIKSKSLLPDMTLTGEEEAEIKDLEGRLRLYQELQPAQKLIAGLWRGREREFSRPYFLDLNPGGEGTAAAVFYPGRKLDIEGLTSALDRIFESFKKLELETRTIKEKIVTIEEKMSDILSRLQKESTSNLGNLSSTKSRAEIIVIFLAILHLAREQLVHLEQEGRFSEITIKKTEKPSQ